MDDDNNRKPSAKSNLLKDDRFKALFTDPEFEVDKNADEYKMLTPVLSRLDKGKVKELKRKALASTAIMPFMEDDKAKMSDDDDLFDVDGKDEDDEDAQSSSDDDDRAWQKDLKSNYRQIRKEQKAKQLAEEQDSDNESADNDNEASEMNQTNNSTSKASMPTNLEFKVKNITTKTNR